MTDRNQKFLKFTKSILYPGSDGTGRRTCAHNMTFPLTPIRRLSGKRNVFISYSGSNDERLFRVDESLAIQVLRVLNMRIKNIVHGEQIGNFISNYDSSQFTSVLVAQLFEAMENHRKIKITTDEQIRAAHSAMRKTTKICVIHPFTRFACSLLERLRQGEMDIENEELVGVISTK